MNKDENDKFNEEKAIKNLFFSETELILGILEDRQEYIGLKEKYGEITYVKKTERILEFCRLLILSRIDSEGYIPKAEKVKITQSFFEVFVILYPLLVPVDATEPLEKIIYKILTTMHEESSFSNNEIDYFIEGWNEKVTRIKAMNMFFTRQLALADQRVSEEKRNKQE